jgi:hypothetical protein
MDQVAIRIFSKRCLIGLHRNEEVTQISFFFLNHWGRTDTTHPRIRKIDGELIFPLFPVYILALRHDNDLSVLCEVILEKRELVL